MKLTKRDFILLAVIIYFTFIGGTFYSQFNLFLRVANQIIVTLILGGWLVGRVQQRQGLPRTPLDVAIGLYLVVNFGAAIFGQSPRFSLEQLWFSLVHVLTFYLLVDLIQRGWGAKLAWAIYMTAAVVCLVGIIEFLAWYVGTPLFGRFSQGWLEIGGWQNPVPPVIYRLNITLNGSTPLAAYLALLIPPAIGLILTLPRRNENRRALIVWLGLAFIVEILTFSRAGILALGVSLPLLAVGWLLVSGKRWSDGVKYWGKLSLLRQSIFVIGVGLALLLGALWMQRSFGHRVYSTNFRFTLWQAALLIFQENWLIGVGPGNFGRALLRLNNAALPRSQIATAHSIYFNTAAELGVTGLLTGAYLYLMAGYSWWQQWRQLVTPAQKIRLIAVGAALVGLAVQVLVDTYTATPNMLIMLALLAYIVALPKLPVVRRRSVAISAVAFAAILIYLVGFLWLARVDIRYQDSFRYEREGNLEEAIAQANQAYQMDPSLPLRIFRLALLEARLAHRTRDPALLQLAIEHYRAGLRQEPIFGLNSVNLAGLLWQQGQQAEAIAMMKRSVSAENNPLYWLNLGYFYEQQQNWEQAIFAYAKALARQPQLAGSDFWQASATRAKQRPELVDMAANNVAGAAQTDLRARLALAQKDFSALDTLFKPVSSSATGWLQAARVEMYFQQKQVSQVVSLLNATPQNSKEYVWRGRVEMQRGEMTAAENNFKTAVFLQYRIAHYYLGQLYRQQGKIEAAKAAYQRAMVSTLPENIDVTIYGRFGFNDLVPHLIRISDRQPIEAGFALIDLYKAEQNSKDVRRVYKLLQAQDHFVVEP